MTQKLKPNLNRVSRPHYEAAVKIARILNKHNFESYIIGGAVRDLLLGNLPADFDLVTNASPEQLKAISRLTVVNYSDAAESFGISRVQVRLRNGLKTTTKIIEVATFRRDLEAHLGRKLTKVQFAKLEDDVLRRDFTINALAFNPLNNELIDHVGGLADLQHRTLRFIGEPELRIKEDPLRILRGIRLKNQLGLIYEASCVKAVRSAIKANALGGIAVDRIRQELTLMFTHPSRRDALMDLDDLGVLKVLMPEISAMHGVMQPLSLHAEGTVWSHTLLAMYFLPENPSQRLAWATILHDVGKPATETPPDSQNERIRFNNHHHLGAEMTRQILKRFNFSNSDIENIAWMVRYHLAIDTLPEMTNAHRTTMLAHESFDDLLELHRADAHAAWSPTEDGRINTGPAEFKILEKLRDEHRRSVKKSPPPTLKSQLGIDGYWLKKEYGLSGRELGEALNYLQNEFHRDQILSMDDAKKLMSTYKKPK